MYNTQFNVKYNAIEEELLAKAEAEEEYSTQDVLDICQKLYQDELLSVFGAESFDDTQLNEGLTYVYYELTQNRAFQEKVLDNVVNLYLTNAAPPTNTKNSNPHLAAFILLFSQDTFYLMHQCICQQLDIGTISEELLTAMVDKLTVRL